MAALPEEIEKTAFELNQILTPLPWNVIDGRDADSILWVEFKSLQMAKCVPREPRGWARIGNFKVSADGIARAVIGRNWIRLAVYYRWLHRGRLPEVFFIESFSVSPIAVLRLGLQPFQGSLNGDDDRARFFLWYAGSQGARRSHSGISEHGLRIILEKIALARTAWVDKDLT